MLNSSISRCIFVTVIILAIQQRVKLTNNYNFLIFMMFTRMLRSFSGTDPKKSQVTPQPSTIIAQTRQSVQLLPQQLSGRILDLELECQKQTISQQIVFELIALYTKAVEFYEEQGNDKYKLYQKRMQNFLNRPMIESLLKGQSGEMVIKKQRKDELLRKAETKVEKELKQLLTKQQQKEKKQIGFIKDQLSNQDQKLQQRIRVKRTMSNRSACSKKQQPITPGCNNAESAKKEKQILSRKLLIDGIEERNVKLKKVYL